MKHTIKTLLCALLLMAFAMSLGACGADSIYDSLGEDGYTVRIRYEAGDGALVNETQNVTIVEVFSESDVTTVDGKTGILLLAPDDSRRGTDGVFKIAMNDGKNNYFSAGWYRTRTPRTDESGNPLDAYGNLTSVSGLPQGYIYSDRWDFEHDLVDPAALQDGELTLYAAWVPYFTYEFYAPNEEGKLELFTSISRIDLSLPTYKQGRDQEWEWRMQSFPKRNDMVLTGVYADEAMTQPLQTGVDYYENTDEVQDIAAENIDGDGLYVDYEQGIAKQTVIKIYTTWEAEQE